MRALATRFSAGVVAALAAAPVEAQVTLNEIFISHTGTDDREFIELIGPPGTLLEGFMVVTVESDNDGTFPGPLGSIDRIYDLSGQGYSIPQDSFFVVAAAGVATAEAIVGGANLWENSAQTVYVIEVPSPTLRATLLATQAAGTVISTGSSSTSLVSTPGVIVHDIVGIIDADNNNTIWDSAPVCGPDGSFLPAGIWRPLDCPNGWCSNEFLDFNLVGDPLDGIPDPTPGMPNVASATCTQLSSIGSCVIGARYCQANANSTGVFGRIDAVGSPVVTSGQLQLVASDLPTNAFGFFLTGRQQGFVAQPGGSAGNLCLGGGIGRFQQNILTSGSAGTFSLAPLLSSFPTPTGSSVAVVAGETWSFQAWHRDNVGGGPTSNFTDGVTVWFQ